MSSADPSKHRQQEKLFMQHVERLLGDDRLRVDTLSGRKPVAGMRRDVRKKDREEELIRLMSKMDTPDRELRGQMPVGLEVSVNLSKSFLLFFRRVVGQIKVISMPAWEPLIKGEKPKPAQAEDVRAAISQVHYLHGVPDTLVLVSTSGFSDSARELAERRPGRTVVLAEPNAAGGWTIHAPEELGQLAELLDPEVDSEKRERVKKEIESRKAELISGGISASRIAETTSLPLPLVEDELKSYAKEAGISARRLDGNFVLFREGSGAMGPLHSGGSDMPFIQRMKNLFARKGDNEKKITLLSERRAALTMQRDQAFEEMGVLEIKENEMRDQFKATTSSLTRRRVTSQLLQLRKDLERRQQLLGMLNQQINVVSTHLHNLELVQQGQSAALPSSEELADDAAKAEEVLAELQADNELAGSISSTSPMGLSEEEQALYEELEKEAGGPEKTQPQRTAGKTPAIPTRGTPADEIAFEEPPPLPNRQRQRGEAEAG
jgi:hypothetical protein